MLALLDPVACVPLSLLLAGYAQGELLENCWKHGGIRRYGIRAAVVTEAADLTCWTPDEQFVIVQCKRYA